MFEKIQNFLFNLVEVARTWLEGLITSNSWWLAALIMIGAAIVVIVGVIAITVCQASV